MWKFQLKRYNQLFNLNVVFLRKTVETQKNAEKDSVSLPIAHVPVYIKTLPYSFLMAVTRRITDSLVLKIIIIMVKM